MGKDYHVVSFSGGKDSTAMLLRMLELGMPVDEIIFCDTGVEFPQMYEHIDKVEQYIVRKVTRLKSEKSFEYYLMDYENEGLRAKGRKGKGFPSFRVRWCTQWFKRDTIKTYLRQIREGKQVIEYVGIAADELKRVKDKRYPLVEWGWTEADCLKYCYDRGFDWGGLYELFPRLSCWCCPLKSLNELRQLRHAFPDLWETLLDWQHKTWRKFRPDYSVDDLEAKFAEEDLYEKMQIKLFNS